MSKRQVTGEVKWAKFTNEPQFASNRKQVRGAKRRGVVYEQKAQLELQERYQEEYLPSPWIVFEDDWKVRWCQPDGLLFQLKRGIITIVEVKYNHTNAAWNQLFNLYLPVVSRLFHTPESLWAFSTVEVVKWYDPSTVCSKPPNLCKKIDISRPNEFGVWIWRP